MMNPLVSIVIATHDRAALLEGAIRSVLDQAYRPIEILVGDDGSTDDTALRVRAFGDLVRHIALPHSGRPSVTRNRALAHARGDFVAFLDDDDKWESGKLSSQIETLLAEPDVGLIFTNGTYLLEDGQRIQPHIAPPKTKGTMFSGLVRDCFILLSTVVVRKTVLDDAGWFDEDLTTIEDFDLWLRIARRTQMVYLPQPLATILKHNRQISKDREHDTWHNMLSVMTRVLRQPNMSVADKLRVRRTLSKTHNHLALLVTGPKANQHYLAAIKWNPLTRAGWRGLCGSLAARLS